MHTYFSISLWAPGKVTWCSKLLVSSHHVFSGVRKLRHRESQWLSQIQKEEWKNNDRILTPPTLPQNVNNYSQIPLFSTEIFSSIQMDLPKLIMERTWISTPSDHIPVLFLSISVNVGCLLTYLSLHFFICNEWIKISVFAFAVMIKWVNICRCLNMCHSRYMLFPFPSPCLLPSSLLHTRPKDLNVVSIFQMQPSPMSHQHSK